MGTSRVQVVAPLFAALLSIPLAGRYPPLPLTSAQQRRQPLAALLDQFEGLARQQPILLLFESVQWADPTSIELLDLAPIKELAQVGAAIGREFSYALLHVVTGRDEAPLKSALLQLEDAELLFRTRAPPDAGYSFKHALVQGAAYESPLKSRRQVLHRRIADALRERFTTIAESEPEIVAHHLSQSGLAEAAVEWWEKAAERAMHASAFNEAIAHIEKASGLAVIRRAILALTQFWCG